MFQFTQIGSSKKSVAQLVAYSQPTTIIKSLNGILEIFIEVSTGMLLLNLQQFQYGINPNDQIVYDDGENGWKLVLCLPFHQQHCWILKINQEAETIYSLLNERCKLIHKRQSKIIINQIEQIFGKEKISNKKSVKNEKEVFEQIQLQNKSQKNESSLNLVQASKSLAKGLSYAGQIVAKGFEYIGGFFAKRVEPSQTIALSQGSKNLINRSVQGSNKLLQVSTQKFGEIFRFAKKEVLRIVEKIQPKQYEDNGNKTSYQAYKENLLTGLHIVGNIYDGIQQGMSNAMNGISKGTGQVIGAKYGQQLGQSSQHLIQGGRNVLNVMHVPKKVMFKQLKPAESYLKKK